MMRKAEVAEVALAAPLGPLMRSRTMLLLVVSGLVLSACRSSGDEAIPVGAIQVTVEGLTGIDGGHLAGVLYRGVGLDHPDYRAIGGFAASVDTDPFSTNQFVRTPLDWAAADAEELGLFPYVTADYLVVERGTYTLMLWVAPGEVGSYSRWVPADRPGLVGCETLLVLGAGASASVPVTSGFGSVADAVSACDVST